MKTKIRILTYNLLRFLPIALVCLSLVLGCIAVPVIARAENVSEEPDSPRAFSDEPEHAFVQGADVYSSRPLSFVAGNLSVGSSYSARNLASLAFVGMTAQISSSPSTQLNRIVGYSSYTAVGYPSLSTVYSGSNLGRTVSEALSSYYSTVGLAFPSSVTYGSSSLGVLSYSAYSSADATTSLYGNVVDSSFYFYPVYPSSVATSEQYYVKSTDSLRPYPFIIGFPSSWEPQTAHDYSFTVSCLNFAGVLQSESLFVASGARYVSYLGLSNVPGLSYSADLYLFCARSAYFQRPSFVPSSIDIGQGSASVYYTPILTSRSFYDETVGSYVFPYSELYTGEPLPPIGGDDGSYDEGYEAGYKVGYSEGYNKGQTEQLNNPAAFLLSPAQAFMQIDLFGGFSLGDAFSVVMFVLIATIFIKLFAGG